MKPEDIKPVDLSAVKTSSTEQPASTEQAPVDWEQQAIESDTVMMHNHRQEIDGAWNILQQQLAAGMITPEQAIGYRQQLQQKYQQTLEQQRNIEMRNREYMKRKAQNEDIEILKEIPQWVDSRVRKAETQALWEYLSTEKGYSDKKISSLGPKNTIREFKSWRNVMRNRMSPGERRLSEIDEKLRKAAEGNPDFGKPKARQSTAPPSIQDKGREYADGLNRVKREFKAEHGRTMTKREVREYVIRGVMPSA